MNISVEKIAVRSSYIILPLAAASLFIYDWRMALGLIMGALIGIVNFEAIVRSVKGMLASDHARLKLMFIAFFKLIALLALLIIFFILKLIHPYGLIAGFTVVFVIMVAEGFSSSRREGKND
jgi:hypothetical protein